MPIYAVFIPGDPEKGTTPATEAGFDMMNITLGPHNWAAGQDNNIDVIAVDHISKVPMLRAAFVGSQIIELTEQNFKMMAISFGEFDPDKGAADWYYKAT